MIIQIVNIVITIVKCVIYIILVLTQNTHLKFTLYLQLSTSKKLLTKELNEDMKQMIFEISRGQKWSIEVLEPSPNFKQSYLLGLKSGNLKGK